MGLSKFNTEQKIEIIQNAINVISQPEKWLRGSLCCDKNGIAADPASPEACKWCAVGAIEISRFKYGRSFNGELSYFHNELSDWCLENYSNDLPWINDNHGREQVIEVLEHFLSYLKKSQ